MNLRAPAWLLLAAVALGAAYVAYEILPAEKQTQESKLAQAPATQLSPGVLRYQAGAPQLSFIEIKPVEALPEPLLDPLNARVAYDENHTVRVSSPIAGRALKIDAQPGDKVAAGQPLLTIDSPDFAGAVADVHKSEAELRHKQLAFDRAKTLYEGEVLARKDLESSETDLRQSEAENMRARLRLANLNPGKQPVSAERYVLRAAISGVVAERQVNPGAEVRPDAPNPLFVITDPAHLWVIIDLPERDLGKIRLGQNVIVESDAYLAERFPARVASIGATLDPATRRIQVRCVLDNPRQLLKPEMFVRVTPLADGQARLPRVPNSALITLGLYSYVFVEKEPGVFERRRLSLGLQGRDTSYVKDGLREGERVVTKGALLLNSELAGTG